MMHHIKYTELRPIGRLCGQLNVAYDRVFNSGQYIGGHEVEAFENEWAEYCEAKYCVGVGNGHDALALACRYFSEQQSPIKPMIFTPWKTCLPTWAAIRNGNMSPVLLNGEAENYMVAVHIYGKIAVQPHRKDTIIIEDCAQAHGAKMNGVKAGKFGKVAAWSFYPTKNLGALGDGGAITTDDEAIANYVREMRNYGNSRNNGINSRLDPLQAAFLRVKLAFLDGWNERRKENAYTYLNNIYPRNDLNLVTPCVAVGVDESCWHIFAIEIDHRDELKKYLSEHNVDTVIHYPSVPYPDNWHEQAAIEWTQKTLSLPVGPHVTPYVCKQISDLINKWMDTKW